MPTSIGRNSVSNQVFGSIFCLIFCSFLYFYLLSFIFFYLYFLVLIHAALLIVVKLCFTEFKERLLFADAHHSANCGGSGAGS